MSGRSREEREEEGSSIWGYVLGGVLAAGAAAGAAYLAYKQSDNLSEPAHSSARRPPPPPPPGGSSVHSNTRILANTSTTKRMESRKQGTFPTGNVPEGAKCVVCFVNEKEVLFEPCNHVCACEDCAEKITSNCPICSGPIQSKKPIYL